jgi:hypothetical protein
MKLWLPILLLVLTVAGRLRAQAPASNSQPTVTVQDENARKARALIDQAIRALGGPAYLGVQDMNQQGRSYGFYHGTANSVGAPFWRHWRFPDKDRVEFTKQRDIVILHNGDKGYEITYKGPTPEEPKALADYLRRRQFSLEWVLRKWLKQPGLALFYEGSAIANQKPSEQVSLVSAQNESVTLFIDATTHLPLKKSYTWRDPADRLRNTEDEVYDNYRPIQGVMTPFSVSRLLNGEMTSQRFINSVSYNQNLPDSLFEPGALPQPGEKR